MDNLNYGQPEERECPKWQKRLVSIGEAALFVMIAASLVVFGFGIYQALQ